MTCNLLGLEHTPACRGLLSVSSSCIKPLFIWRQEFLSGCDWIVTGSWLAAPAPHSLSVTRIPVKSCQNISQASVKSSHDTQPTNANYVHWFIILVKFKVIDIQFRAQLWQQMGWGGGPEFPEWVSGGSRVAKSSEVRSHAPVPVTFHPINSGSTILINVWSSTGH